MPNYKDIVPFKAAIIQEPPVYLNIEASIEKALILIKQASQANVKIIAFPETWLTGYPIWLDYAPNAALWDHQPAKEIYRLLVENSISIPSKHFSSLLKAAKQSASHIIMGCNELFGNTLYNTMLFLHANGQHYKIHRKLVPTYTERLLWGQGDGSTLEVMETEIGNIGGLVCWEHWMPLPRVVLHQQHELIHVAQWPAAKELHQLASRHYAFEGQCFVLVAGCNVNKQDIIDGIKSLPGKHPNAVSLIESIETKHNDGIIHNGGSSIIAPNSEYIAKPAYNGETIVTAEVDPKLATEGHLTMDISGHYSRPDIFKFSVNKDSRLES